MQAYIIRRLMAAFLTVFVISIAVFWLLRVAPGDPALLLLGMNATDEQIAAIHQELGLDQPLVIQYFDWLGQVLTGNLGESFASHTSVSEEIVARFPVTLELLIITLIFTVVIGIPIGVISAVYRNTPADYVARVFAILGLSIPTFWLATLVLIIPSQQWGYSPPLGHVVSIFDNPWDNMRQFGPPAFILGLTAAAGIMRLTRSSLLEVLRQDYIRTARAKGLRERVVILKHALRNSLVPVVTVLGLQIAALMGGTVIVEVIFGLRGLGAYMFESLVRKDFVVVQTMTIYLATVVVLMNLAVDILYAWLDPRIRYS